MANEKAHSQQRKPSPSSQSYTSSWDVIPDLLPLGMASQLTYCFFVFVAALFLPKIVLGRRDI